MTGDDYIYGCDVLGISWGEVGDFGKSIFPVVHETGGAVLRAFGAGALVDPIESLERRGGLLPPAAPQLTTVTAPDFVVVAYADASRKPDALTNVAQLSYAGGKRFPGSGYVAGGLQSGKFSFGVDEPSSVAIMTTDKRKFAAAGVKQFIVGGGVEGGAPVVLGRDFNWWSVLYDPAGEAYRSQTDHGNTAFYMPQSGSNAYWKSQRDAAKQRSSSRAQGDIAAARDLQSALRQQQATQAAAIASYAGTQSPFSGASPFASSPFDTTPPPSAPDATTSDTTEEKKSMGFFDAIIGMIKSTAGGGGRPPAAGNRPPAAGGGKSPGGLPPPGNRPTDQKSGIVVRQAPASGRQFTSLKVNRDARYNPKKALQTARTVAARAQDVGKKIADKAAKFTVKPKTAVHGAPPPRPTPARQQRANLSAAQLSKLAASTIDAGKKLDVHAGKYAKQITAATNRVRAGEKRAIAATKMVAGTKVRGDFVLGLEFDDADLVACDTEILGIEYDLEILGAPTDPDPLNPGYLIDGTPDPAYGAGGGDGSTGGGSAWTPGGMAATLPGPPDFGAGPPPSPDTAQPQPYIDFMVDPYPNGDDPTFYDAPTDEDLPLGAVIFDGSRPIDHMGVGSYTVFFGQLPGSAVPKGGPNSGFSLHGDGKWWLELKGPGGGYNGDHNYDVVSVPNYAMQFESQKNGWGPLIGNPRHYEPKSDTWVDGSWTKGLRFSPSGPQGPRWFWYWDMAPVWAKQNVLQNYLNDAITTYKAAVVAGQTDYLNAVAQDKLDANDAAAIAREQAKVDADTTRRQQIADQQQAEFEQKQLQTETQQDTAYSQFLLEQERAAGAQDTAFNQLLLERLKAHPEELDMPLPGGGGGGYADDSGGDEEDMSVDANVDWGEDNERDQFDEGA